MLLVTKPPLLWEGADRQRLAHPLDPIVRRQAGGQADDVIRIYQTVDFVPPAIDGVGLLPSASWPPSDASRANVHPETH
jgi:hypothetical protein